MSKITDKIIELVFEKIWGKSIVLLSLPSFSAWFASKSSIFSDQFIIWIAFMLGLFVAVWVNVGIQHYRNSKKDQSQLQTFVRLHKEREGSDKLTDYSIQNIRYHDHIITIINENNQITYFHDIVFGFINPTIITTIRVYGIDGSKPNFGVLEANSYFVRLHLSEIPNNKFMITFNEKINDEFTKN